MDVTPATPHRGPLGDRLAREPRMLPEDARRSNRGLILRALHHGGPASRADLAKLVGLTPATVSAVIKELLEAGLVDELGRTSGAIGKPATMVGIEPDARHIVTVSLSEPDQFVGGARQPRRQGRAAPHLRAQRPHRRRGARAARRRSATTSIGDAERPLLGIGVASPGHRRSRRHGAARRPPRLEPSSPLARPARGPHRPRRSTSPTTPTPRRWPSSRSASPTRPTS